MAETLVFFHRTHGDFVPWNIRMKNGELYVFDWEDSLPKGLPFTDAFHFIYLQASLVGPWPGAKTIWPLLQKKSHQLYKLAGYSPSVYQIVFATWMIQEYFRRSHPHILELMSVHLDNLHG